MLFFIVAFKEYELVCQKYGAVGEVHLQAK